MKFTIPKKFLSLQFKITLSFLSLVFLSSTAIGLYSYNNAKSSIEKVVGDTALSINKSIVKTIDTDKLNELSTQEDMDTDYYKQLHAHLEDIRKSAGLKYLYTMRKTENGKYIYVVDGTPTDDKNFSALGDEEKDITNITKNCFEGTTGYEFNSDEWGKFISAYTPILDKSGKVVAILGADFDGNNMASQLNNLKRHILIIAIVVMLFGLLIGEVLSRFLVSSLNKLRTKAESIKQGDLAVKFDEMGSDEIGVLAHTFKEMTDNLLTITNDIKNNTANVVSEIDNMYRSFGETNKAAGEISQVISEIAAGALDQAYNVDDVSKSMDEVFEQVEKSVEHAKLVSDCSSKAMVNSIQAMEIFKTSIDRVTTVNNTVENTALIIQELGNKSKEIISFSETISQITQQTNLLALNASIEAARAGEQGKGFAVVANEVNILAEQSNEASRQIGEIAESMQTEINNAIKSIQAGVIHAKDGVNSVTSVDSYLVELQRSNKDVCVRIKEIMESINLIEKLCKGAAHKVHELADISRTFSAGSQQAAAASEEQSVIMQQIEENLGNIKKTTYYLDKVVNKFKIE